MSLFCFNERRREKLHFYNLRVYCYSLNFQFAILTIMFSVFSLKITKDVHTDTRTFMGTRGGETDKLRELCNWVEPRVELEIPCTSLNLKLFLLSNFCFSLDKEIFQ